MSVINASGDGEPDWPGMSPGFRAQPASELLTDVPQKLAVSFLVCALASQLLVILISFGLDSATPAASLMFVQALAEIVNRTFRILRMTCALFGGEVFCFTNAYVRGIFRCAFFSYNELAFALMPDYITLLMSLDRVFTFSLWYKEKWTKSRVWVLIGLIFVTLQLVGLPRLFNQQVLDNHLKGKSCRSTLLNYDQVMFLMGVPAVILVGFLTAKLVYEINSRRRAGKGSFRKVEDLVTIALATNCVVYAIFNFIQYSFIILVRFTDDQSEKKLYRGIAFAFGAFGVALRGPIYLTMRPMRRAFLRAIRCDK